MNCFWYTKNVLSLLKYQFFYLNNNEKLFKIFNTMNILSVELFNTENQ